MSKPSGSRRVFQEVGHSKRKRIQEEHASVFKDQQGSQDGLRSQLLILTLKQEYLTPDLEEIRQFCRHCSLQGLFRKTHDSATSLNFYSDSRFNF